MNLLVQTSLLIGVLIAAYFTYRFAYSWVEKRVLASQTSFDDFMLKLFKGPLFLLILWLILNIFSQVFFKDYSFFVILGKINTLLLIFTLTLISVRFISAGAYYLETRYDLKTQNNLRARKSLTQVKVFKAIAVTIIVIIAIGSGLMTFEQARKVGISVLTSAGILGIIVGLAAQKSIGMILAGIQLAITQPIRLDDIVIVEGEFGRIEEIELTYVVVQIWDERRMILPVTWFLDKPFQNLTRTTTTSTGTIFLYVDYSFPVDSIRKALPDLIQGNNNWDGRTANIQVTNTTDRYKEIRIVLSSSNSSKNWDLRTDIREKLIDFINANYPESFSRIRVESTV